MTEHERPSAPVRPGFSREDWDDRYAQAVLLWSAEPNRRFATEVAGLAPGRALDIGCGEGRNAIWLAEHGWGVTGVDFSSVALAKAERLAATRGVSVDWVLADVVDWVLADVVDYRPSTRSFDLVVVLYLQLPAVELHAVLAAAAAAVAPGGTLFVLGHDTTNLTEGYGGPKDTAVLFTPEEVVPALAGLDIECAEKVRRSVALDGGEAVAIDALVRARRPG